MYLTYADYQSMGGALDETTFNLYEFEAEALINWYTFNRLKSNTSFPQEVSKCMYVLISLIEKKENASTLGYSTDGSSGSNLSVTSQSNDGVSISYNTVSAQSIVESMEAACKDTIQKFLNGVVNELGQKLLYRGLYPNE